MIFPPLVHSPFSRFRGRLFRTNRHDRRASIGFVPISSRSPRPPDLHVIRLIVPLTEIFSRNSQARRNSLSVRNCGGQNTNGNGWLRPQARPDQHVSQSHHSHVVVTYVSVQCPSFTASDRRVWWDFDRWCDGQKR